MKTTRPNWNVKKMERMMNSGSFRFDYPIQRAGGQWDILQKSLLIHSMVCDYPVPPVLILKSEDADFVIDGKQRITNILDYISGIKDKDGKYPENAYPLHEETPDAVIEGRDDEIQLGGLYFDQLDEDIQSELTSFTLQVQRLEEATDEEIEELFFRWNNGTPLTKQQKTRAKMGVEKAVAVDKLQKHSFMTDMAQFTPLQRRRSDDEAVILQTMMLMSGEPIESLVADKILAFATSLRDIDTTEVEKAVKDALDYLHTVNTTSPLFKKLHLPTLLIVAKKASDDKVDPEVFKAWVDDFNTAINMRKADKALVKTDYKKYTGAGSVKKDKVLGRQSAMLKHFEKFQVKYAKQLEEMKQAGEVEELKEKASNEKVEVEAEAVETVNEPEVKVEEVNEVEETKEEETKEEEEVALGEVDTVVNADEVLKEFGINEEETEEVKEEDKATV